MFRERLRSVSRVPGRSGRVSRVVALALACLLMPSLTSAGTVRMVSSGSDHSCALTVEGGVVCWGSNAYGQLGNGTTTGSSVPVDVTGLAGGVISLSVGKDHACVATVDGFVKCWGANAEGQLGDGTTENRLVPVAVGDAPPGVVSVAAGQFHSCVLTELQQVLCWGRNDEGQVGDGAPSSSPVDPAAGIFAMIEGAAMLSASGWHTCAVTTTGGAKCWGYNAHGELGDGTTTNRSRPTDVSGLTTGVTAVGVGLFSTCALKTDGGMSCWGRNNYGQLGDNTTTDRHTPVVPTGLAAGVAALAPGDFHTCAVLGTGALRCWGANSMGQLGDGSVTQRLTPVEVTGLASGVALAAGGLSHTCALMADGAVRCWGYNANGQLGDGTTASKQTAVGVAGLAGGEAVVSAGVRLIVPGGYHVCALTNAGGVVCWGDNAFGQLGDGTTRDREMPVPVHGLTGGVAAVSTGRDHSCAVTTSGGLKCWGDNTFGQLGDGSTASRTTPVDVTGLTSGVAAVDAGRYHTCVVTTAGAVKCWGSNDHGQIGDGTTIDRALPLDVTGLAGGVASVSAGGHHGCALTTSGGVKCWGSNDYGELGNGTLTASPVPVWVSGLSSGAQRVKASLYGTCALTSSGGVKCWGYNFYGQVGDGTTANRTTPVDVIGLTSGVAAVSTRYYHACARTADGRVLCWGDNAYGQLGDGTTSNRSTPVTVTGLTSGVTSVVAGLRKSCIVTPRAGAQCWGSNENGQLGDGTTTDRPTPGWVRGLVAGAGTLAGGQYFSCRLTPAGGVQCWGRNNWGQLGDGTTADRWVPGDVAGLGSGVVSIAAGSVHACALTVAGGVKCWGFNASGQLGDGTHTNRAVPVDVQGRASGTVAIAAGNAATCAVTASGGVTCWGSNTAGQLGDGTTVARPTAGWVAGLTTGATSITAGNGHACVRTEAGGVKCWGRNTAGNLGDGTTTDRSTPVCVSGLMSRVEAVSTHPGALSTCALMELGGVKCWGRNAEGQLGDGTTITRTSPTLAVIGLTGPVASVVVGSTSACAVGTLGDVKCWGENAYGQFGDGSTTPRLEAVAVPALASGTGTLALGWYHSCAVRATAGSRCAGRNDYGQLGDGTTTQRLTPTVVRGFKAEDTYDADQTSDVAVYRPSTGTWFSLDSSSGNASYQVRGWGVQAQGDTPAPGDYDGDGIVDPTVFRAATGSWFVLRSGSNFTAWDYFGWGSTGDVPVPADYDGDGITDGAVYRPATGIWYIRPSSGAPQWNIGFGNATDIPIPGHYDADGRADIAVYRPSTGTWFVLTSSSGYEDYWYRGWGIDAQGDTPALGDYDGDGKLDPCVFRASTGTWFVLESQFNFTTWRYFGWGQAGDTVVPSDYDGDGVTDAAVYRPSTGTWYVRPSSGATQWSVVFGAVGNLPLGTFR